MATKKITLKKLKHISVVKKLVNDLLANNGVIESNAGEVINTILCEYLTERECRSIILKVAIRNKNVRDMIKDVLNENCDED